MAGITQRAVFEAANQLESEGQRVTVDAVRAITGGSNTTVVRHLQTWRAQASVTPGPTLPGVPESARAVLVDLWHTAGAAARRYAEADFEAHRAACRESVIAANRERDDARAAASEADQARAAQAARLTDLDTARRDALERVDQLEASLAEARAEAEAERAAHERQVSGLRIAATETEATLRAERDSLAEQLAERTAERDRTMARYESDQATWMQRIDTALQARDEAVAARRAAERNATELRVAITQADHEAERARQQQQVAEQARVAAQAESARLREQYAHLEAAYRERDTAYQALRDRYEALQAEWIAASRVAEASGDDNDRPADESGND